MYVFPLDLSCHRPRNLDAITHSGHNIWNWVILLCYLPLILGLLCWIILFHCGILLISQRSLKGRFQGEALVFVEHYFTKGVHLTHYSRYLLSRYSFLVEVNKCRFGFGLSWLSFRLDFLIPFELVLFSGIGCRERVINVGLGSLYADTLMNRQLLALLISDTLKLWPRRLLWSSSRLYKSFSLAHTYMLE